MLKKDITTKIIEDAGYRIKPNGDIIGKRINTPLKPSTSSLGRLYIQLYIDKKSHNFSIHRLVGMKYLNLQPDEEIDHIDRNPLNNNVYNLRICTRSENGMNRSKNIIGLSKYKGVSFHKGNKKWQAYIKLNRKLKHLGYFKEEAEAAKTYDENAKKLFGQFACLNNV